MDPVPTTELDRNDGNRTQDVILGAIVAEMAAVLLIFHAGIGSIDGVFILVTGVVTWMLGMWIAFSAIYEEYEIYRESKRSEISRL